MKNSEIISAFIKLLDEAESRADSLKILMIEQDELTQDILHSIEMDANYNERNKLATKLKYNRLDRRYYKDLLEELKPIVEWMSRNTGAVNSLKQTLGAVRKEEKYHENRTYCPRVLKEAEHDR